MNEHMNPLNPPYWQYFLAIEDDLLKSSRYVEFVPENFHVHSIEFARILISSSSEIDVIAKELCQLLSSKSKCEDMVDYKTIILKHYPLFLTMEMNIPRFSLNSKPWDAWVRGEKLDWWKAYNEVKHERSKHYGKATLGNAMDSVAALFSLLLYFYRQLCNLDGTFRVEYFLNPPPQLFASSKYLSPDIHTRIGTYNLPDEYVA
jgi:hypothetical protein